MKKKILLVNKFFYHTGGIEEFTRNISLIQDESFCVKVLACSSEEKFVDNLSDKNKRIKIAKTNFRLFNTPISFSFIFNLIKYYFQSDIIHLNSPFPVAEVIVFLLSLIKSKKIIVTYHSDVLKQKIVFFFLKPFIMGLLKKSTVVITSEFLGKSQVLKNIKTITIPLSQPDKAVGFVRDYSNNVFCLFVGRLVYYKGIFTLLEAMKYYSGKLKIIGTGPLESEIKRFIIDNNLQDKIELLGFVNDEEINHFYREASFFVFPSIEKTEAFGIVQISAMSFGLPIINTSLATGVPWVARNNFEAITIKPGDEKELLNAMNRLGSDESLRKEMGGAARKRFLSLFEQSKMLEAYKNLYKSI